MGSGLMLKINVSLFTCQSHVHVIFYCKNVSNNRFSYGLRVGLSCPEIG
jgi:hypothetical protein